MAGGGGGRKARRSGLDNPADLCSASAEHAALMDPLTSLRPGADPPPPPPNLSISQKMSSIRWMYCLPIIPSWLAVGREEAKKKKRKSGTKGGKKNGYRFDQIYCCELVFLAALSSLTKVECKGGELALGR